LLLLGSLAAMLCLRCRSIRFGSLEQWVVADTATAHKRDFCVLHATRESFQDSLTQGCHLCIMISGLLGLEEEGEDSICEALGAFLVLEKAKWPAIFKHIIVRSGGLGGGILRIIDPVPGSSVSSLLQELGRGEAHDTHYRHTTRVDRYDLQILTRECGHNRLVSNSTIRCCRIPMATLKSEAG